MRCHRVGWYYGFSCKRRHKRRLLLHVHLLISTNPASKRRSLPRCGSSPFFLGGGGIFREVSVMKKWSIGGGAEVMTRYGVTHEGTRSSCLW